MGVDELDLAEKLLRTFHLSVPERAILADGRVRFSTLVAAARRYLEADRCLPEQWQPGDACDGPIIQRLDGDYWLHERYEIGVCRFSPLRSRKAASLEEAVRCWLEYFCHRGELDGVPIDFDS